VLHTCCQPVVGQFMRSTWNYGSYRLARFAVHRSVSIQARPRSRAFVLLSLIVGIYGLVMEQDLLSLFGQRVRERRIELGLTQRELADRTGLNRSYIGEIELGRRNITIKNAVKIARALQADVASFLGDKANRD
jgi:DNA-binding XRE family transcriptional regulator